MASKESAVDDQEPLSVLFALHDKFDLMDFAAPLEAFHSALHELEDPTFEVTVAASEPKVMSEQGVFVGSQISFKEAYEQLDNFDILVVVGGNSSEIVKTRAEPMGLITHFADLQKKTPTRERTLLSICTGSLMLAELGILAGLAGTTHPDYMTAFENLCSHSAVRDMDERTEVIEDARYVVNNLRFDLDDEDQNPYIRRKSDERRPSNARKGSISLKSATRRESIVRRAAMRLGGLRVVTSGGVSAGVDATLYLISALVSDESANNVAERLQWTRTKGVVVNGLDV